MKKIKLFQLLTCFVIAEIGSAQNTTSSPYSSFGLGDLEEQLLTPQMAMGHTKYGWADPSFLNIANPASHSTIVTPIFDLSLAVNAISLTNETSSADFSNTYFRNVVLGLPLKGSWGMSLGLIPYSKVGYDTKSTQNDSELGNVDYIYQGSGGLNQFFWGNGINIHSDSLQQLSIGINTGFIFGSINRNRFVFPDANSGTFNVTSQNDNFMKGFSFNAGLMYNIKINEKLKIGIGTTYELSTKLNAIQTNLEHTFAGNQIADTISFDSLTGKISVPEKINIGLSTVIDGKWTLMLDYSTQDWSKFNSLNNSNEGLVKQSQLAFGLQFLHDAKDLKLVRRTRYRIGSRFNNTNLNIGEQLKEFGITFGLGIPLKFRGGISSSLNVSGEFGQRGVSSSTIVKEQFSRWMVGFSFTPDFHDRWFAKRKIN